MDMCLIYVHIYVSQIDKYRAGKKQREAERETERKTESERQRQSERQLRQIVILTIYFIYLFMCRPHAFLCSQLSLQ